MNAQTFESHWNDPLILTGYCLNILVVHFSVHFDAINGYLFLVIQTFSLSLVFLYLFRTIENSDQFCLVIVFQYEFLI